MNKNTNEFLVHWLTAWIVRLIGTHFSIY